jgi:hypothetical protein
MKRKVLDINSSDSSSTEAHEPEAEAASAADKSDEGGAAHSAGKRQSSSRRGHFKSRLGCFNCKRRRIKCNEVRPSCSPCRRLALSCDYPTGPPPTGPVTTNPSVLNLEDLRFYHRFLTVASPTLPLRDERVWAQCAAMSHQVGDSSFII